jgi:hypothetical protein
VGAPSPRSVGFDAYNSMATGQQAGRDAAPHKAQANDACSTLVLLSCLGVPPVAPVARRFRTHMHGRLSQ